MGKTAILSVRITSDADGKGFRKAVREIQAFERDAKRSNDGVSRLGRAISSFGKSLAGAVGSAARMGTMAAAATTAVGGLAAPLAAVGSAAAGAIGPMAALGAAMSPAALGSAALAAGVLKSLFSGFGDALSAADPAKFAEAIAEMPPAAAAAATALNSVKDSFTAIGKEVQQSFWANVSNIGQVAALVEPVRSAMLGLAADMGNATAGLIDFVSQGVGLSAVKTLLDSSAQAGSSLAYAFADVVRGVIAVGAAAAPVFADMSAKLAGFAQQWADSMVAGFQDGSLQQYFADAVSKAQALFGVLQQLGSIVSGVFGAMSAAGMPFLGMMGQAITATEQWVNSAQGMAALQSLFSALSGAVAAVLPIIGQLAAIVGTTLAPAFASLVTTIAPVVSTLVTAFAGILSAIAPVVPIVGQLAALFGSILAPAIAAITPIFAALAQIIGGVLQAAIAAITPIIPTLVAAFQQLAQFGMMLMPAIQSLASAFMSLMGPIASLAGAVIPGLVAILGALMPAISAVIQGVAGFVSSLGPLISLVSSLAGPVLGALAAVLGVVSSAIAPLIQFIVQLALQVMSGTKAFNVFKGALNAVKGAASGAVGVFNTVRGAIQSVIGTVSALIGALSSIRWPSPPAWFGKVFGGDEFAGMQPAGIVTGTPLPPRTLQAAAGGAGPLMAAAAAAPVVASGGGAVVNITVNGAIDPRETAEQIRRILRDDARTRGIVNSGGYGLWQ